jgi:hypothetical protein
LDETTGVVGFAFTVAVVEIGLLVHPFKVTCKE